jgi:DNA gyrase subunit A
MPAAKIPISIEDEMRRSYLDYAMSVIVGRALPDVRDGLKPVHRRVLYAMYELGLTPNRPYRKSARVVGEVLGKYHPHGDAAIYETIVRMVQDFSLRYPLIDGQGNFGSVDGDEAAAMRYTEIRLAKIAQEMLADIEKETVDFVPNFDDSLTEPKLLPAALPNLLVNGSSGIAVGMATNIPPHNLNEVADALIFLLQKPEATLEELMGFIQGPDFPTAGYIYGRQGILDSYRTGRGHIQLRAKAFVERSRGGKVSIIVSQLPYQVNKAKLIEEIASLVREKRIEGIADLRDESDREGMRLVIELKRDEVAEVILNQLYKFTPMQTTFGVIMLALVDNQPRILSLKEMLQHFIEHRKEVVLRRTRYDLRKAEERAHVLEGYRLALGRLDEVIRLIRASASVEEARQGLVGRFGLTVVQADAILELRLQRLTRMEREKIAEEYEETLKKISRLKALLESELLLRQEIIEELRSLKQNYGDERRTEIVEEEAEIRLEDMLADEEMVVTVSHGGYIKRSPLSLYRSQKRGGKGSTGMITKEEDYVENLFVASTHTQILFFTDRGRVHWLKVHQIPQLGRAARGRSITNLLALSPEERITAMVPVRDFREGEYLVMATARGIVKKTALSAYAHPRTGGIIGIDLEEGDQLIGVGITKGEDHIFLGTRSGLCIRFSETDIRPVGRVARGVKGVELRGDDAVVAMEVLAEGASILAVTENGYGKRTPLSAYRLQRRGGKGVINIRTTPRNGRVVGVMQVSGQDELMMITQEGRISRLRVAEIREVGRNAQGVKLQGLQEGDRVAAITRLVSEEEEESGGH